MMSVGIAVLGMAATHGRGHKHFNVLAEQFTAAVAKDSFSGFIEEHDLPVWIYFKNRIRRRFQELAKPALKAGLQPGSRALDIRIGIPSGQIQPRTSIIPQYRINPAINLPYPDLMDTEFEKT
jgi:hypothetical protein